MSTARNKTNKRKRRIKRPIYQLFSDVDDTLHPAGDSSWRGFFGGRALFAGSDWRTHYEYYNCVKSLHSQMYNISSLPTVIVSANFRKKKEEQLKKISAHLGNIPIDYIRGERLASCSSSIRQLTNRFLRLGDPKRCAFNPMAQVKIKQITEYVEEKKKKYGNNY